MGVRPPTNDGDDEPAVVTFGIAALDARLDEATVTYPADADDVVDALGDPKIPYDASGNSVRLSETLEQTQFDRFQNEQELLNALHPVFEGYRERAGSGIVAQLRSLLPF